MRRLMMVVALLGVVGTAQGRGILIPIEKTLPPLAMLNHQVKIDIEDQVAITRVEQTFRNHTDRQLEATYVFPVPKGASVQKFSMWVNGKEVPGELVPADKARKIYTSIVQRTLDPGLLEYMGNDLLRVRVFPVPPRGDQKLAITYTSVVSSDNGLMEYIYPLKHDGKSISTLEKFTIDVHLKAQRPIQNIYSPSHAITMTRPNDREARIVFEKDQAALDRDFQLYYTAGSGDVGLTALAHRPSPGQPGYFLLLASPRIELSREQQVPRDMVFVLDTSGSMQQGNRIAQARKALKYCLDKLTAKDRFTIVQFATTANRYTDNLVAASPENLTQAKKWVDGMVARGGTAINDALQSALDLRSNDAGRSFTIVFFTDGQPTFGETNVDKILKNVLAKNNANTRIFTFGVGDDVNAAFLDQLADQSRAVSSYVRENEDIETKTAGLINKISNPVLTNLKLTVSPEVKLSEVYPPHLPDLFHGSQLVILGRYTGDGKVQVKLTGQVGMEKKEFTYSLSFPSQSPTEKPFVEDLWARRKVGYLLDEIRRTGENKELVEEVVALAKRYGITTPYTSYLIVPDAPVPVGGAGPRPGPIHGKVPPALFRGPGAKAIPLAEFAKDMGKADGKGGGGVGGNRGRFEEDRLNADKGKTPSAGQALEQKKVLEKARRAFATSDLKQAQAGKLGVDLAVQTNNLRNQTRLEQVASRTVNKRTCIEIGGVWIDEAFTPKTPTITVKALSKAYFRILEKHPEMRAVLTLGNFLVWITPSGTALVVDLNDGRTEMPDADIDRLFVASTKK